MAGKTTDDGRQTTDKCQCLLTYHFCRRSLVHFSRIIPKMNELILVVDDEPKIVKLARDYLEQAGFRVASADNGTTAIASARRERPDLVVLDLRLPDMDGLDVCRTLRRDFDVSIIMLTARDTEADRLIGLELGADDYVTKPFSPRELVARVRAVLRRAGALRARSAGRALYAPATWKSI